MATEQHSISVVTPIFDRDTRLLGEALDSIFEQSRPVDEVIVVDDGSPEAVQPWIERHYGDRVTVLRQDNQGIGSARNRGLAHASGTLLACLDSDDVWMPDKIERQLAVLEAHPELDAVYGRAEQFHDQETDAAHRERYPIRDRVIDAWLSTAQLIHREAFERVGPYWERPTGVDVDWMMRANDLGLNMRMLDFVVYRRRIHTSNIGISDVGEKSGTLIAAVRESLERRRRAEADG